MKKLLVILMSLLVLTLVLAACQQVQEVEEPDPTAIVEKEKIVIGLTCANMANEFNAMSVKYSEDYVNTLENVELRVTDGAGLAENQVAQCETFVTQGVDAVIMNPYDVEGCTAGVQACFDANIPVLTLRTYVSNMDIVNTHVGSNDVAAGEIEMQHIADLLDGKGNIVILEGPTGISAAVLRNEGINNILKKYPDINVLYTQPADWDRAIGMATMENWLQLGEDINAVVAHNDEMALGAYDAIAAAGLENKIPVIGIDAISAALVSVYNNELTATVLQDAKGQAIKSVDVAIMLAKGEPVEKEYLINFVLITKENIGEYYSE